jgi:hypothetical protein
MVTPRSHASTAQETHGLDAVVTQRQRTAPAGGGVALVVMAAPVLGVMVWLRSTRALCKDYARGRRGGQKESRVMVRACECLEARTVARRMER